MNYRNKKGWVYIVLGLLAGVVLAGCKGGSSTLATYQVTVVNATNNQPLSPVAVVVHDSSYIAWTVGSAASTALEQLAEGGVNSELLSASGIDVSTGSGGGAIAPGASETISVSASSAAQNEITVATMLVNTNDAFAGLRSIDVSGLSVGESMTLSAKVYDAGTELDSESAGTIPGPADGGEGFNANRSDVNNFVRGHGGTVTVDDGLSSSVLNQSHRFDNPGMVVTIRRM